MGPSATAAIDGFWELFVARAAELARAASADSAVYDELLERLQQVDAGLYFEFSIGSPPNELIITADGKVSLFPLVRKVVDQAPSLGGWRVLALKPKLGFPERTRWDALELRLAELTFVPLERPGSDALGLRIFVPGLGDDQVDDAHNAVLRALDHGLGEEQHALTVQHTEVRPARGDVTGALPLVALEEYLARRHQDAAPSTDLERPTGIWNSHMGERVADPPSPN